MSESNYRFVKNLETSKGSFKYLSLKELEEKEYKIKQLPYSIRILLENALRNFDDFSVTDNHISNLLNWTPEPANSDVPYKPSRVLMQDFTGVPSVVDIAAIRSEVARKNKNASKINPQIPVDLIIDHSVQVDYFGTHYAYERNVRNEYKRNAERYKFLKWGQSAFDNFSVLAPGLGICHQVNLENLATVVTDRDDYIFPDTLVGTDSHTPMVNGIGVVGWGVGGIEAEAAMLGQPIYFTMPEVIGVKLTGKLQKGTTATDLVLSITEMLRKNGVVGKFVEFFGSGLDNLSVPDRATISNMSPEFGCTITYFPSDNQTLRYMRQSSRSDQLIETVEQYTKENLLWRQNEEEIKYSDVLELDLDYIVPSISGPKKPHERISVNRSKQAVSNILTETFNREYITPESRKENTSENTRSAKISEDGMEYELSDASVVVAAITSCTNTSNPDVMVGAGLIAKKAVEKGITTKPWIKTSLAPGSQVVTKYLKSSGLLPFFESLRFHVVGYGCTTCIGNSGDLPEKVANAIREKDLAVASVLSGNRNFEARIHPDIKMNFLASPMLVVIYALAGRVDIDLFNEPVGLDPNNNPVYMEDLWPDSEEIQQVIRDVITPEFYKDTYRNLFAGNKTWENLEAPTGEVFQWDDTSTYVKEPPFFQNISDEPEDLQDIEAARPLLVLGDSITTDHISPAGKFSKDSPAGQYLVNNGVAPQDFNSYGSRRGNHEVMIRGTFGNVRIKNEMVDRQGGFTKYIPDGKEMTVYEAAMNYQENNVPLVVIAGKEYGSGSSRDWAAKGSALLGIKAVIAESFERIHRSNLVGTGVLPLQFKKGESRQTLGLDGNEKYYISGISDGLSPGSDLNVKAVKDNGKEIDFTVQARIDSGIEVEYYKHGGILQYVLRKFLKA